MPDLWTDLLECHRLFGGQLLGQFVQTARLTCPDKAVKSLHAVFAREGRADEPVSYEAIRHHEGRSFATLTITARQSTAHARSEKDSRVLATSSICMHVVEDGPEHQAVADVPPVLGPEHRVALDLIPWETRAGRRPQRHQDRPATVRIVDAHAGSRPRSGSRPRGVCHRPHAGADLTPTGNHEK